MTGVKVLCIRHRERRRLSNIALYLRNRDIDVLSLQFGVSELTPTLDEFDAAIVLGGPMSVCDKLPWMAAELDFLKLMHSERKPILGICLGAQLVAHALGARVYESVDEEEIGFSTISLTEAGQTTPLFAGIPAEPLVMQWHKSSFDLPSGASLLATSSRCPNQAFSSGLTYGLQFHFEISPDLGAEILEDSSLVTRDRVTPRPNHLADSLQMHRDVLEEYCNRMMKNFLELA